MKVYQPVLLLAFRIVVYVVINGAVERFLANTIIIISTSRNLFNTSHIVAVD